LTLLILEKIEEIQGRFLEWSRPRQMWIVIKNRNKIRTKVASTIKQYNRQKGESQQLTTTIKNAAAVVPGKHFRETDQVQDRNQESEGKNLRHYYSIDHAYFSKRRKVFCDIGDHRDAAVNDEDFSGDNSCFGRSFFPT